MAIALRHRPLGALTVFLCAALLLVYVPVYPAEAAENENGVAVRTGGSGGGYQEYLQAYEGAAYPEEPLLMSAGEAHAEEEEPSLEAIEGVEGTSVLSEEGGALIWIVEAPQAGLYSLTLEYLPVKDKASTIERSLTINGRLPFENAAHFTFYSNYVNDGVSAGNPASAGHGRDNDVRPSPGGEPPLGIRLLRRLSGTVQRAVFLLPGGGAQRHPPGGHPGQHLDTYPGFRAAEGGSALCGGGGGVPAEGLYGCLRGSP